MKTAIQQLIDWVHNELKLEGYEHQQIIDKATDLLSVERQQIEKAYDAGYRDGLNDDWKFFDSQDYYEKNYEVREGGAKDASGGT